VGQPQSLLDEVIVLPWNDLAVAEARLREEAKNVAAVLVDPLPSRLGYPPSDPDFLPGLRRVTQEIGALLILDEVYALRLDYHGAHGLKGIRPDLVAMGKIIGGGFPVGAIGGSAEVMSVFGFDQGAPKIAHGGTYNANPITMAAGLASMQLLDEAAFDRLAALGDRLRTGFTAVLRELGIPGQARGDKSLAVLALTDQPLRNYRDIVAASHVADRAAALHRALMNRGVLTTPVLLFTLSTTMTEADIDFTIEQVRAALREL
jgi:glutamate-1-semialdehyde 2,1-aminomutase